jgi:hypothetical protein
LKKEQKMVKTLYPQARLLFETYDGSKKDRRILSLDEARGFPFRDVDCCLARCLGVEGYKDRHGKWRSLANGKALGCHGEEILKAVMRHPGLQLDKVMLSQITSLDNLVDEGILPARVYYLRGLFGETKSSERVIRTFSHNKTMTVMWPRELTWVIVEPTFEK